MKTLRHPLLRGTLASAALVGALAGCSSSGSSETTKPAEPESTPTASTTQPSNPSGKDEANTTDYVDGVYSADGSYVSPGGQETINVSLTLSDGVVTAVSVDNPTTRNSNSLKYQGEFIAGIADEVVGVAIDDLNVDRVGGSSLTSGGFNQAVESIKAEAAVS